MKKTILPLLVVVVLILFMGVVGNAVAKPQKITICHMPRMNQAHSGKPITGKTLRIPLAALDAHLGHGDTLGPCSEPYVTPVDKGDLNPEDLIISNLGAGNTDRWTLDLVAGDAITITVAPATASDVVLSLFDSNNVTLVNEQNFAVVGAPETISNFTISNPGIHTVQIQTLEGTQTDYALMFMDANSYSFIFKGRLVENAPKSGNVEADTDHFWFFNADGSDSVSFRITPNDNGDPYIELYDPNGARMLTIDDTGAGEVESLTNYTLLDGGMYSIRVAEFDFQPMSYTIELLPYSPPTPDPYP